MKFKVGDRVELCGDILFPHVPRNAIGVIIDILGHPQGQNMVPLPMRVDFGGPYDFFSVFSDEIRSYKDGLERAMEKIK